MQPKKIGFYPVSAMDYLEPLQMLKGWVDHLVFCDIRYTPPSYNSLQALRQEVAQNGLPEPSFILGDAQSAMEYLKPVDLFFLRRDSDGEGGSGLHLLGPARLPSVIGMIKPGGWLVTDRMNAGPWFDDFRKGRRSPYRVAGRMFQPADEQPWAADRLLLFAVK